MNINLLFLGIIIGNAKASPFRLEFECPGNGIYSDPDNCQCFYDCANNVPYQMCCPAGTLFDEEFLDCDFAENVDCGERPGPDGSTHPHTTTSTTVTSSTTSTTATSSKTSTTTSSSSTYTTTESTTTQTLTTTDSDTTSTQNDLTTEKTTSKMTTTTDAQPPPPGFPSKVLGMYILLADDTEDNFHTDAEWEPKLYPYQQSGANVLFFTFINPETMLVPESFKKLALSRGTGGEGSVPADTRIIFAIGGYSYSIKPNPWAWLTSSQAAEEMAINVAQWVDLYKIDGIDLDIEAGAGDKQEAGPNMIVFIRKLKSLKPDLIVSQPTYGYPQVKAEIDVINASWKVGGGSNNLADSVGLMVYEGTQSLQYVDNYAHGSTQWEGFPIEVDVPKPEILLGCKGSGSSNDIMKLAQESISQDLLGIMVWYCSVQDGLKYEESWDCSGSEDSKNAFVDALTYFEDNSN